jgi:hypothetical protein
MVLTVADCLERPVIIILALILECHSRVAPQFQRWANTETVDQAGYQLRLGGLTMKVAFGMKAHSGWAALVVLGTRSGELQVVDRCRMELVENDEASWAKQPYHAAESLKASDARDLVKRGVAAARRIAVREMRTAVKRAREGGHDVGACAVLVGDPMPDWSVDEILAVHFRMHKAEGVLFRDALVRAATACHLRLVRVHEKQLDEHAEQALANSMKSLRKTVASLGKSVGPPWGKDQKDAALAAMIALQGQMK